MNKLICILICLLVVVSYSSGDILINEFNVKNTPEWVELYNTDSAVLDLTGYILAASDGDSCILSAGVTIPANGYLILDSINTIDWGIDFASDFSNSGDVITFKTPADTVIDSVSYGNDGSAPLPAFDWSTGRVTDGVDTDDDALDFNLATVSTKGSSNNGSIGEVKLGEFVIINECDNYPDVGNDKIEIYNPTPITYDLNGWYISDGDDVAQIVTTNFIVPVVGFNVIDATDDMSLAMNFSSGDVAYLFKPELGLLVRVDQIGFAGEFEDDSFQRYPDGAGVHNGYDFASSDGNCTWFDLPLTLGSANANPAPIEIIDLLVSDIGAGWVELTWTAPGADGTCGVAASEYNIRYSTYDIITSTDFDNATQAADIISPSVPGIMETFVVKNLHAWTTYYFAIKTADEQPLWSDMSNVVNATTRGVCGYVYQLNTSTPVPDVDVNIFQIDDYIDIIPDGTIIDTTNSANDGYYEFTEIDIDKDYTLIASVAQPPYNDTYSMSLFDLQSGEYTITEPYVIDIELVDPVTPVAPVHNTTLNTTTVSFQWEDYTGNALTDTNLPWGNATIDSYWILVWYQDFDTLRTCTKVDTINFAMDFVDDGVYYWNVVAVDSDYFQPIASPAMFACFDYPNIFVIDRVPPTVASTIPDSCATGISLSQDIIITFDEAMDRTNTESALSINPEVTGIAFSWSEDSTELTVAHDDFSYLTKYTVTISTAAADIAGNLLDGDGNGTPGPDYVFYFTTQPEPPLPYKENLWEVIAYPNPASNKITFKNLTKAGKITIYNMLGEKTVELKYEDGVKEWYLVNEAKQKVGPGIYFYVIEDSTKNLKDKGKIAVVR